MTQAAELALCGGQPVRRERLPFHRPGIGAEEEAAVAAALRSGWLTMGPRVQQLETASERHFSLPLYPGLAEADVQDVAAAIRKVLAVARSQGFPEGTAALSPA